LCEGGRPVQTSARPQSEKDSVGLFIHLIDQYKGVEKMIASDRRNETLREIERRREHLAPRLRKVRRDDPRRTRPTSSGCMTTAAMWERA
jgi:hypothetical protein